MSVKGEVSVYCNAGQEGSKKFMVLVDCPFSRGWGPQPNSGCSTILSPIQLLAEQMKSQQARGLKRSPTLGIARQAQLLACKALQGPDCRLFAKHDRVQHE